jgi:hypothetical protein
MNKKLLFQLVCVLALVSCRVSENGYIVLDIDKATNAQKQLDLSHVSSSVKYVCLETKEECLIDETSVVYVGLVNNNFLIADLYGCYLFDPNGEFVKQIGGKGEGPGEYVNIGNVWYDDQSKQIFISSTSSYADGIIVFDEDGNYKKTLLPNTRISDWTIVGDSVIVLNIPNYLGDSKNKTVFISQHGDTLSTVTNYDHFQMNGSPLSLNNRAIFYLYNNEKYYLRTFNDTVYRITRSCELVPAYVFLSSSHKVSDELRMDGGAFVSTDFDYIIPWSVIETDRFLFVHMFRNKKGLIPYCYDKQSKEFFSMTKSVESDLYGFADDLSNNLLSVYPQYVLTNNLGCILLSASTILSLKDKNPEIANRDFCDLEEDSNPVLSVMKVF